jgi:chaperonin GroES
MQSPRAPAVSVEIPSKYSKPWAPEYVPPPPTTTQVGLGLGFRLMALLGRGLEGRVERIAPGLTAPPILGAMRQELRPLFDRVVIKELEPDRVRQSGLVVPPGSHEPPPQHGIVLAVGPGIDWWESAGVSMPVKPGDHVVFPASAGVWVEVEEEKLLVCRVGELLGVLETADERSQAGQGASET